ALARCFPRTTAYLLAEREARAALLQPAKARSRKNAAKAPAKAAGAHYLLYCRFARGDNRIGNWEEWEDEEELGRVGRDRSVIQVMLIETSTRF
ncbi:DUF4823 domain-containing protein, partial [Klebsiella pneumoniae]|uniref:DUF4823 domain-containing protein n=1 Tax=Klebsiella pneumoniae TaxID=573 RepID=UPI00200F36D1